MDPNKDYNTNLLLYALRLAKSKGSGFDTLHPETRTKLVKDIFNAIVFTNDDKLKQNDHIILKYEKNSPIFKIIGIDDEDIIIQEIDNTKKNKTIKVVTENNIEKIPKKKNLKRIYYPGVRTKLYPSLLVYCSNDHKIYRVISEENDDHLVKIQEVNKLNGNNIKGKKIKEISSQHLKKVKFIKLSDYIKYGIQNNKLFIKYIENRYFYGEYNLSEMSGGIEAGNKKILVDNLGIIIFPEDLIPIYKHIKKDCFIKRSSEKIFLKSHDKDFYCWEIFSGFGKKKKVFYFNYLDANIWNLTIPFDFKPPRYDQIKGKYQSLNKNIFLNTNKWIGGSNSRLGKDIHFNFMDINQNLLNNTNFSIANIIVLKPHHGGYHKFTKKKNFNLKLKKKTKRVNKFIL